MKKEPTDNQEFGTERPAMTKLEARTVFFGMTGAIATGSMITPEMMKSLDEAVVVLNLQGEDNERRKPPKPPRGRTRRIGGFALGNT